MSAHDTAAMQPASPVPAAQAVTESKHELGQEPQMMRLPLQFRLSVGAVDDPLEAEADAMADKVMRMPDPMLIQRKCAHCEAEEQVQRMPVANFIQRKCAHCEEEEKTVRLKPMDSFLQRKCAHCEEEEQKIQRKADGGDSVVSNDTGNAIAATRGLGSALPDDTRTFMETRFGTGFEDVRIHTGDYATKLSNELSAQAFTIGNDIYFNSGKFSPSSDSGKHLLAHELTHTIQQGGSTARRKPGFRTSGAVIRRTPLAHSCDSADIMAAPAPVREQNYSQPQETGCENRRRAVLPNITDGQTETTPYVIRLLVECPCRNRGTAATGTFWDPDANNFAIAFSYCQGRGRADLYAGLSNLANSLSSGSRLAVTGRAGVSGTVATRHITINARGEAQATNEGAGSIPEGTPGVGGMLSFSFEQQDGAQIHVSVSIAYIRRLGLPDNADPNEVRGALLIGNPQLQFQLGVTHTGNPGGDNRRDNSETAITGGLSGTWEHIQRPDCYNCKCPPPHAVYECIDFVPDREVPDEDYTIHPSSDINIYFHYDSIAAPEESTLQQENNRNLRLINDQVRAGARLLLIRGFASPEGNERDHNHDLSERRAGRTAQLVRETINNPNVFIPVPYAGDELLGHTPAATPNSRLGDIITANGFRSAEDLSMLLTGPEIANRDLSAQFLSLFRAIPDPDDRLALFGLRSDSPIARRVLTSITAFEASGGRGYRPWENVFRLLRVGIVRVERTEVVHPTTTHTQRGSVSEPGRSVCDERARQAEARNLFGPIGTSRKTDAEARAECAERGGDEPEGCNYRMGRPRFTPGRLPAPVLSPFNPVPIGQPAQQ
ncbi:eCIS core domain-containing protein [Chitinophaga vietnamensis]|uniref:eCIS core domain-containing protein n=1 Tax=Chitinophaga vietnamensis TaxID=2593957 RepID=UPI0011776CE6|nr:DUF4157 domain-containing protein [Chitinophaga vietnamensis]